MARSRTPIGAWGEISVFRNAEGPGYRALARFRHSDGKLRPHSRIMRTKGAAREELLKDLVELRDETLGGTLTADASVSTLADTWFQAWMEERPQKESTIVTYERNLRHIRARIPEVTIREATTQRLEAVIRSIRKDSGDETARQVRNVLRMMFAEATRLGATRTNPVTDTRTVRPQRAATRAMTKDEVRKLRDAARKWESRERGRGRPWDRPRIVASIDVMLGTGTRPGETLAQLIPEAHLSETAASALAASLGLNEAAPLLEVTGTLIHGRDGRVKRQPVPKSKRSERILYLPAFAVETISEHLERLPVSDTAGMFPTSAGTWLDPNNYRARFREVRKLAGLDWVTPKTLRKTIATTLAREVGLQVAGDQLGHSELGVTSRHYVQQSNLGPAEVVAVMDEFAS
jgi:integrase